MSTIPDVVPADAQQSALSDQAGDATPDTILPSDVTKAPVVDQGALSYPTPSTICYNFPLTEVRETAHTSPVKNFRNRGSTEYVVTRRKRKRAARASPTTRSNTVSHMLLKSCVFRKGQSSAKNRNKQKDNTETLGDEQIKRVLRAGAHLVSNDLCGSIRSHLEN